MDREICARIESWVDEHFEAMIGDLQAMVRIPSVSTYEDPDTPFGPECLRALREMLRLAERYGFEVRNYDNMCGSAARRSGDAEIAIWTHLDVVPAGDGWTYTQPFEPIITGDYMIGRGADDNKGPALAVLYILRAFDELNLPTRHSLKLCFGTDEEHGMKDVQHYAAHYPQAKLNLVADCGFPVCYGEKGIIEANIVSMELAQHVLSMQAGLAGNIVPDRARMTLRGCADVGSDRVRCNPENGITVLEASGISRHSAFPEGGINAIHEMTGAALKSGLLSGKETAALGFFHRINDDFYGTALEIAGSDEVSGATTCTGTMASLREDGRMVLHVNIRYHILADSSQLLESMRRSCGENSCTLEVERVSEPNYFPRENPVVDALTGVYNELTGLQAEPYVMGGGTYARKLPDALGFGMGGLPRPETQMFAPGHGGAHQCDESLYLPGLKRAMVIFAMGLLEADRVLP